MSQYPVHIPGETTPPANMRELLERVWDEGFAAGWGAGHVADKAFNPYRVFTQDEK